MVQKVFFPIITIYTGGFYKKVIEEDKGIKISKQILDKDGNTVTSGYQGDELTVVIDIIRTDTLFYDDRSYSSSCRQF